MRPSREDRRDDDARPAQARRYGSIGRTRGRGRDRRPGTDAARAPVRRRASARASTSTAPSATPRSGPATWAPWSGATTASCPGAVYTKGFLRNYALYLGLDPDEVLRQWRRERGRRQGPASRSSSVPRPIATPRKGLTFSPGHRRRRAADGRRPRLRCLSRRPAPAVRQAADDRGHRSRRRPSSTSTSRRPSTRSAGRRSPGATVSIATPGRDPYQVTADADGAWAHDVELRRGRNQFDVNALDPDTGKQSEETIRAVHHRALPRSSRRRR